MDKDPFSWNKWILITVIKVSLFDGYPTTTRGPCYDHSNKYFLGKNPCLIDFLPEDPVMATQIGIYLQKNSPFTHMFE